MKGVERRTICPYMNVILIIQDSDDADVPVRRCGSSGQYYGAGFLIKKTLKLHRGVTREKYARTKGEDKKALFFLAYEQGQDAQEGDWGNK